MEELKTLKDLEDTSEDPHYKAYMDWELKAEAVKWVKQMKRIGVGYTDLGGNRVKQECCKDTAIRFFNHFFNLTEEDLE